MADNNVMVLTPEEKRLIEQYRSVNRQGQIYLEKQGDIVTRCGLFESGTITFPTWKRNPEE